MWFNPAEITKIAKPPIATLATYHATGNVECSKVAEVAKVATTLDSIITQLSLQDRQREARRQKVIAMLEAEPDSKRAIYTDIDSDPNNVILAVAIRHVATCEMLISKDKYDPWRLLELIKRIGSTTH